MNNTAILNFFDKNRPCPNSIVNCEGLRLKYFTALDRITSMPKCKDCNVTELKSYFIDKFIKFKKPKIFFDKKIFESNTIKQPYEKRCSEYIFLTPYFLHIIHCKNKLILISNKHKHVSKFTIKKFFLKNKNDKLFILFYDENKILHKINANIKEMRFNVTILSIRYHIN